MYMLHKKPRFHGEMAIVYAGQLRKQDLKKLLLRHTIE